MPEILSIGKVPINNDAITLDQTAVQNTWYTVTDQSGNIEIMEICLRMQTAAEDLELKVTVDGVSYTASQAGAIAGTTYYFYNYITPGGNVPTLTTSVVPPGGGLNVLKCKAVKVEIRKTSANGANKLQGGVWIEKW